MPFSGKSWRLALAASVAPMLFLATTPVLAETIESALVRAYQDNPQLNAQRASVRSTDENVPQALSGYRPKVAVTASGGSQYTDTTLKSGGTIASHPPLNPPTTPRTTNTPTLYIGPQTANRTPAAESQ